MDSEKSNWRFDRGEIAIFVVMSVLCVVATVVLFFGHPSSYSFIPRCPFYSATGLYCPGCGSLRATHYLLHGDWTASLRNHPLLIPLLCFFLFLYGKRLLEFRCRKSMAFRSELPFCLIVLAVFFAFFVLRNVPVDSLEWSRPPVPVTIGHGS